MIGIYCYYREDAPVYVGASIDIERRRRQHKNAGRFADCDFRVLEETTTEDLFDRERHYITEWDMCQVGENKVIHNNMDMPEVREAQAKRMRENNPMKPGMTNSGSFKKGQKPDVPKIKKIILNMGLGEDASDGKKLKACTDDMALIAGQKPVITAERNKKIAESKKGNGNPNFGKTEVANHLNENRLTCPVCHATMNVGNYKRWNHGPECSRKSSI